MDIHKEELECYARLLKSSIETGGWLISECASCQRMHVCKDGLGGYKGEYLLRKKLTNLTGINLVECIPYVSEKVN